jgi:membrane dipeptidase
VRRLLKWSLALLAPTVAAFFILAPGMVDRSMNKVSGTTGKASARSLALHRTLVIADMHADTLLWKRSVLDGGGQGHVDLKRMQAGNVALQVFSSVTKTPKGQNYDANGADTDNITMLVVGQLQPPRTWTSLLERSLWHAEKLRRFEVKSHGELRIVRSQDDLARLISDRASEFRWPILRAPYSTPIRGHAPVGALLSIEGLQNLEGKRANLDVLYKAGFRMAGLAHFFDNDLSGSMHGLKKGGLTPLGRQIVRDMEAKGMVVDIAHASHAAVAEILTMAKMPVVSSHGGVQATCKVNRNLTDEEIKGVAKTGGVVGIGYWDGAVCDVSPASIARAIQHVRDLVGIDHVGLGSDYDGSTTVAFDTSHLVLITQALIDRGFTSEEISKVMGGNVFRVLAQTLPAR